MHAPLFQFFEQKSMNTNDFAIIFDEQQNNSPNNPFSNRMK